MTTDLRDKTVEELRFVKINTAWLAFQGKAETIPYSAVAMEAFDELARRLAEAEQKIAERDAMLAQCVLIGRNILLALTPDLPKNKRPTFEEFSNSIQSLPASAKANAEILRAAKNRRIVPTEEAADAFWKYWRENGETHKHGYYESTWGAINAALAVCDVNANVIRAAEELVN